MSQRFSDQLREEARPIWERVFQHPFLAEIEAGTLPIEKFRYYLIQDWKYLEAFARGVALALAKAPDAAALEVISKRLVTPIEKPLHRKLMGLLGITESDVQETPIAPTNLAYSNHVVSVAALGSLGAAAAALLPCPWTYHRLGGRLGAVEHPVYGPWASVYAEGLLEESVATWTALVDREGAGASQQTRQAMRDAFMTSSRYEFLFWDMAYRQESWPV